MFWRRRSARQVDFIAFGLGNPGQRYAATRHNMGYRVLDELARRCRVDRQEHRHHGAAQYCTLGTVPAALVKPTTYMNLSGGCVSAWRAAYPEARFYVIFDDLSLPAGVVRFKRRGSSGGHRGVESIIQALSTTEFDRLKVGIGAAPEWIDATEYVLSPPTPAEDALLRGAVARAADALTALAADDMDQALRLLSSEEQT